MLKIHLESHGLPARFVTQNTVRIADVPEHEYRKHKRNASKGTNTFTRRLKALPPLRNDWNVDQHTHNQQNESQKDGVVTPIDIPTPSVRNGQIIENKERDYQNGKRNSNYSKMPAANAQTFKNILHA
jgi:hypothetical protein